jgi:membrane protease YdiL (CAAX protease family)
MVGLSRLSGAIRGAVRERSDDRLRATWRICIPVTLFGVVTYGSALFLVYPLLRGLDIPVVTNVDLAITGVLGLVGSLAALAVASRLDRRPFSGYGFGFSSRWWADLVVGLVGGVLVSGAQAAYGLLFAGSEIAGTFTGGSGEAAVAAALLFLIGMTAIVLHEEFVFRSILIPNIAEGVASRGLSRRGAVVAALLGSSLLFVPFHWVGGVSIGESFLVENLGYFLMGVVFALPYVLTGEVAFSIGLHMAYNLGNAYLFGIVGVSEMVPSVLMIDHVTAASSELLLVRICVGIVVVAGLLSLTRGDLSLDTGLAR